MHVAAEVEIVLGSDHRIDPDQAAQRLEGRRPAGAADGVGKAEKAARTDVDRVAVGGAPGDPAAGGLGAVNLRQAVDHRLFGVEGQGVQPDLVAARVQSQPVVDFAVDVGGAVAVVAHAQGVASRCLAVDGHAQVAHRQAFAAINVQLLLGNLAVVDQPVARQRRCTGTGSEQAGDAKFDTGGCRGTAAEGQQGKCCERKLA
eukprot:gene579-682_t